MKKLMLIMVLTAFSLKGFSQVQMKGKYDFRDTVQFRRTVMAKGGLSIFDTVLHIRYSYSQNGKGFFFSDMSAHNFTFAPTLFPPTGLLTGYLDTSQANTSILVSGVVDMDPFHSPGRPYYMLNVMACITPQNGGGGVFTTLMQSKDGMQLSSNQSRQGGWGTNLTWDSTFSITNYNGNAYNGLSFDGYAGISGTSTNRFSVFCHPDFTHFYSEKTSRIMLDTSFAVLGMGESNHWQGDYLSKLKLYSDSAVLTSSLNIGNLNYNKLKLTKHSITLGFAYDFTKMTADSLGHHFNRNVEVGDTLKCNSAPLFPKIYSEPVLPNIPENSAAFWYNTSDSTNFLIYNKSGVHKVQLDTTPVFGILKNSFSVGLAWNTFLSDSMVFKNLDNDLANPSIFRCLSNKVNYNRDTLIVTQAGYYKIEFTTMIHAMSWNLNMYNLYFLLRAGDPNGYMQVLDEAISDLTGTHSTVTMSAVYPLKKGDRVMVQSMNSNSNMTVTCGNTKLMITKIN